MSPLLTSRLCEVSAFHDFKIGQAISPFVTGHDGPTMIKGRLWSLPTGVYTARQVVESCAPLLETVLHNLGPDPEGQPTARHMLIDNLASNLALGTRESSLVIPLKDASRKEFAAQAVKIGEALVSVARETENVSFDPKYAIRSPCEGHLLKPEVAYLMFGPRSLAHLMQIHNEYPHQMILLRDALLPFENFDDVVIPIQADTAKGRLGMRFTETSRMVFIAELMTKQTTQASVVNFAQSVLCTENSYEFQYRYGLILPAPVVESSSEATFEYKFKDYYSAPPFEVAAAEQTLDKGQVPVSIIDDQEHGLERYSLSLVPGSHDSSHQLRLLLEYKDGHTSATDVGQMSRGHRFSYQVSAMMNEAAVMSFGSPAYVHTAKEVLTKCGGDDLVTAPDGGIHLIQATSQAEILALLGTIYPTTSLYSKQVLP
ncbi:hypothetical protein M436DRAFT_83838 [Aureobasidium namibiae CBS 147.97]|uniref:Uncharacterized protein n=1 Tax=Aureobasidium namibiae CBS 147.97 TaxID=1043004 RepID=A0A074X8A1_9PEZI